jgi:hypothetical protein
MAKAQQKAMEIKRHELEVVVKRICGIMDITTLLEEGIKILNPN